MILKENVTMHRAGKCLDADRNNEYEVVLYSCSGAAWQQWQVRGKTLRNKGPLMNIDC